MKTIFSVHNTYHYITFIYSMLAIGNKRKNIMHAYVL